MEAHQQDLAKGKATLEARSSQSRWGDGLESAFRSLEDKQAFTNWAAKLLDDPNWADKLQKRMSSIFQSALPEHTRSTMQALLAEVTLRCKYVKWRPFSEAEMRITMAKRQNHKTTGPDGIALEARKVIDTWRPILAELLNDSLHRGCLPRWATEGASVLLPKCLQPLNWSDTRPITISSAVVKWTWQLLLRRGVPLLQDCCRHQWASIGKHGVELVHANRKLARVAHEWKTPFSIVKIDIATAFDSIAQECLGDVVVR